MGSLRLRQLSCIQFINQNCARQQTMPFHIWWIESICIFLSSSLTAEASGILKLLCHGPAMLAVHCRPSIGWTLPRTYSRLGAGVDLTVSHRQVSVRSCMGRHQWAFCSPLRCRSAPSAMQMQQVNTSSYHQNGKRAEDSDANHAFKFTRADFQSKYKSTYSTGILHRRNYVSAARLER